MKDLMDELKKILADRPELALPENADELTKIMEPFLEITDADEPGYKNLRIKIKQDTKEFKPRATYKINVDGPHIDKKSKFNITYDNDDFESELDLVLGMLKTAIMGSQMTVKQTRED